MSALFQKAVAVRFNECDGLGHVNNGTYFVYMEEARMEIFELFNPSLSLAAWNLIVASARCDFLEQVTYGERLLVFTWISKIGNSSFSVEHALQNISGVWVARGQAVLLAYDYEAKRPVALWPAVREALIAHQTPPETAPSLRS